MSKGIRRDPTSCSPAKKWRRTHIGKLPRPAFPQGTVSYAGQTFSYSYDAAGRLSQIDYPPSTNVVVSFTKTDTTTGWDPNGQLLSVRYLKSGTEFQRFVYSYDNSGNRKTMDEVRTLSGTPVTVNWAYTYDGFNRLAQVYKNSNLVSVYTYDESDNRTQVDWPQSGEVWKMTFDIADRIEKREYKVGAGAFSDFETYTHDDDGNMTSRTVVASSTTVSYDWNSHNRLRQVRENGAHKESTSFDHGGIRRLKADSGGNTKYFSSGGMSLADTRPSGQVSFLQGHQLLGLEESGNLYYFVTDGLSSVRLVLDSSGNIQGELRYNEWGVPEAAVSPLSAPAAGLSGHSYTGGLGVRNDGASLGLYYARQRFFDPHLARWLTPDPIGFSGGLNLYAYVENQPVGAVDPDGLVPIPIPLTEAAIVSQLPVGPMSPAQRLKLKEAALARERQRIATDPMASGACPRGGPLSEEWVGGGIAGKGVGFGLGHAFRGLQGLAHSRRMSMAGGMVGQGSNLDDWVLRQAIKNAPDLTDDGFFNFFSHGNELGLVLNGANRSNQAVAQVIRNQIAEKGLRPSGVQLNACFGGKQAQELSELLGMPVRGWDRIIQITAGGKVLP